MQIDNNSIATDENHQGKSAAGSRHKILEAASALFLEGGVAALSVRAISKRAGLSTIGIYSHFNGKQGVLDALYIEGFNKVYDAMNVDIESAVDIDDVLKSCEAYLDVAYQNEAHYRLIFGESGTGYEPSAEAREAASRSFKKLVSNTGDYIQTQSLEVDTLQGALDIWAVMHGYVSISHHAMSNEDLDWAGMALAAVKKQIQAWS